MADLRHYCRYCRYWYRCKLQLAYVCTLLHESPMSAMYMSTNCDRRPPSYQNHIFQAPYMYSGTKTDKTLSRTLIMYNTPICLLTTAARMKYTIFCPL